MQLSLVPMIAALLFVTACTGEVGPISEELAAPEDRSARRRDAGSGKDADRSASSSESSRDEDDADERDGDEQLEDDGPTGPVANNRQENDAGTPSDGCKADERPLALGMRVREIALYQGVKIGLYKDGAWKQTTATVPVIQGRRSLVRVLADTLPGYVPHPVRAVLTLNAGGQVTEMQDERTLMGSSTEDALPSSFSFDVPGDKVGAGTELTLRLEELACGEESGEPADTLVPTTGAQPIETLPVGKLRVVIVPISVNGRLPVTSEPELAKMKAALLAYYPVPDVDLSVHAPLSWPGSVSGTDSGAWTDLLNQVMLLRRNDKVESDVYYFGLIQPAATFGAYCRTGCVLGLAPQVTQVVPAQQVGLGASFADDQTYDTMVHELGHAHGRGHSPCVKRGASIEGVDRNYPDPAGSIVSWGWDNRTNKLMKPTTPEIMGYCDPPAWISDYTYAAIAARASRVNLKALVRGEANGRWEHVLLYQSGAARWGGASETEKPGGDVEVATVLDANGGVIDYVEVVRTTLSHSGDQFLYVPQRGPEWFSLELSDRILTFADVLPAL